MGHNTIATTLARPPAHRASTQPNRHRTLLWVPCPSPTPKGLTADVDLFREVASGAVRHPPVEVFEGPSKWLNGVLCMLAQDVAAKSRKTQAMLLPDTLHPQVTPTTVTVNSNSTQNLCLEPNQKKGLRAKRENKISKTALSAKPMIFRFQLRIQEKAITKPRIQT